MDLRKAGGDSVSIRAGIVIGFDVVVADKDVDDSFSWVAWGRGAGKTGYAERLGDVVLVGKDTPMGKLQGRLRWEETGADTKGAFVNAQSSNSPALWVQIQPDSTGAYEVELPAGTYRVYGLHRRAKTEAMEVELRGRSDEQAKELRIPTVAPGAQIQAGKGRRARAGRGNRQRLWESLGVADGLPSLAVAAIHQDRAGYLWLGTAAGASRYDGEWVTTFTTQDGLAGNNVRSILEDRHGNLWFATLGGGVSRYDGKQFTTFTTQDGLAGNYVFAMLEDRQGLLWFATEDGVSQYDGKRITTLAAQDRRAGILVFSLLEDRQGNLWYGTRGGGAGRYDGQRQTAFTTSEGLPSSTVFAMLEDRQGQVWFGTDEGVSRYNGRQFTTYTTRDGLAHNSVYAILQDRDDHLWFATDHGVSRYDGNRFTTFTTADGLPSYYVSSLLQDREGYLWIGTSEGGISRYRGEELLTLTTRDGLAFDDVVSVLQDRQGYIWFGTGGGASRYDGRTFRTYTASDGLGSNNVRSIVEDGQGNLWFGTAGGGVSRLRGKQFTTFSVQEGPKGEFVFPALLDRQGHLWFGTIGGASRYDGHQFTHLGVQGGREDRIVTCILEDRSGDLWFGTNGGGADRYDGEHHTTLATADGLGGNEVWSILEDQGGGLWFGTVGGGVSRYDGKEFTTFTREQGLADNNVWPILEDREGDLWFGTYGGGVSRYDGQVFQTLQHQDGLAGNAVQAILEDREGSMWFCTTTGVTRFRPPSPSPPPVFVDAVVADRRYESVADLVLPAGGGVMAFEFHGISFKTRPDGMLYRYRLRGYDGDWKVTRERRVEYQDLPTGDYTFEVKAIDRDLAYSEEPAVVRVVMRPPYEQLALVTGLGLSVAGLVLASGYAVRRRRAQHRAEQTLMREMQEELQTAHDLQMGLMPKTGPSASGYEFAGRCLTANHVGGDFFQYFNLPGDRLAVCITDVTGHAMDAAIPAVMFDGILDRQMRLGRDLEELFADLNGVLCEKLSGRTHVAFAMAEIDLTARSARLANAGCPYPCHFRRATGEAIEVAVEAYPFGVRSDTTYRQADDQLESGDYLVFYSDGLAEAANSAGDLFTFERTVEAIRTACAQGLSAEAVIDHLLAEVRTFTGDVPQADDMTCVVVRLEE